MKPGLRFGLSASMALVFFGCPAKAPVNAEADAGAPLVDAKVIAHAIDAGPPQPLGIEWAVVTRTDGGEESLRFEDGDVTEVGPATGFTLTTPVRLKDYRVRLIDWVDHVVPSDDTVELGDGGLTYRIELSQPLESGRRYDLVVDAELGPEIADEAGRRYDDVRLSLKVRGEIQPEKPKKKSRSKK
jgi:hypothetical protein